MGFISQFKVYIMLVAILLALSGLVKYLYDENKTLEYNFEATVNAYEYSIKVQEEVSYQEGLNHAEALSAKRIEEKVNILKKQRGEIDEESNDSSLYSIVEF